QAAGTSRSRGASSPGHRVPAASDRLEFRSNTPGPQTILINTEFPTFTQIASMNLPAGKMDHQYGFKIAVWQKY
ncbi:MAG TPA: hypothetical protein VIV11_04895, partial [Kofleriaceae bacterium]